LCPIQAKILESNFKTGAINRSATPPDQARIRDRKFITPLDRYSK
jgi:hypothetical protein